MKKDYWETLRMDDTGKCVSNVSIVFDPRTVDFLRLVLWCYLCRLLRCHPFTLPSCFFAYILVLQYNFESVWDLMLCCLPSASPVSGYLYYVSLTSLHSVISFAKWHLQANIRSVIHTACFSCGQTNPTSQQRQIKGKSSQASASGTHYMAMRNGQAKQIMLCFSS